MQVDQGVLFPDLEAPTVGGYEVRAYEAVATGSRWPDLTLAELGRMSDKQIRDFYELDYPGRSRERAVGLEVEA